MLRTRSGDLPEASFQTPEARPTSRASPPGSLLARTRPFLKPPAMPSGFASSPAPASSFVKAETREKSRRDAPRANGGRDRRSQKAARTGSDARRARPLSSPIGQRGSTTGSAASLPPGGKREPRHISSGPAGRRLVAGLRCRRKRRLSGRFGKGTRVAKYPALGKEGRCCLGHRFPRRPFTI